MKTKNEMLSKQKGTILELVIGILGTIAGLLGVQAFYNSYFMVFPIGVRMVLQIVAFWVIAIVPFGIMLFAKDRLSDYGFSKENIGCQILIGIISGLFLSFVLTLTPCLFGKSDWVDNGNNYRYLWQFIYEFVYCILAVGLVEEYVFRGFVFSKLKKISNSPTVAVIVSSIAFGLYHFLSGNIIQMIITCIIGLFFCICREKIKGCTLLSLIIAHGIYDAMISVWAYVF